MNKNLLIVGAGIYGVVAEEIAESTKQFEKISFIDDKNNKAWSGEPVIGTTENLAELAERYSNIIVAIGDPKVRLALLKKIKSETSYKLVSLVSPDAFIASSARVAEGCIIEPKAVIHTHSVISYGCIVSAGAVVNHGSVCKPGVHVDCNATVAGNTLVPSNIKVPSGTVFKGDTPTAEDYEIEVCADINNGGLPKVPHGPIETETLKYNFDDVM